MKGATRSRWLTWASALAILAGTGLRFAGARDELWLDEIWSIQQARQISSPVEILTRLKVDNNHPLNTFWLWLVGDTPHGVLYRLPAVLAGAGTLALAGSVGGAFLSAGEAAVGTWLLALSFPLIVYDSEARGYALAVFFGFFAFWLSDRYVERRTPTTAAIFCLSCILGFLSHATFLFLFFPLAARSVLRLRRAVPGRWPAVRAAAALLVPAALCLGGLALIQMRGMGYAGGPRESTLAALTELILSVAGLPFWPRGAVVLAAGIAACLAAAVFALRSRDGAGPFLAGILLLPILITWVFRPPFLFLRYFLVCLPFLLFLLAGFLGNLWRRGTAGRAAAGIVLAAVLSGNALRTARFLVLGRGHYREAVQEMSRESRRSMITVTSDHDFRNAMVLAYYARVYLPRGSKPLAYSRAAALPPQGTEWLIRHSTGPVGPVEREIDLGQAGRFRLWKIYPYCGELSGFNWLLYHRS